MKYGKVFVMELDTTGRKFELNPQEQDMLGSIRKSVPVDQNSLDMLHSQEETVRAEISYLDTMQGNELVKLDMRREHYEKHLTVIQMMIDMDFAIKTLKGIDIGTK